MKIAGYYILDQLFETDKSRLFTAIADNPEQRYIIKTSVQGPFQKISEIAIRNEFEVTQLLDGELKPIALQKLDMGSVLIRPFIEGITLTEWRKKQKRTIAEKLKISILLCRKLEALHNRNLIHKEINPGNIIVTTGSDDVHIIDYGLSAKLELKCTYLGNPQQLEGTLEYISPEQTGRMNRTVDYRCDLYSLGATLYELFTDTIPFDKSIPFELIYSHIARSPIHPATLRPDLPGVIGDIIIKLLAKNAEDRYQSASRLNQDLEECLLQWKKKSQIEPFQIGQYDVPLRFQIPQKLYGREHDRKALLDAFEMVANGRKILMLVGGYTGIGKTALIYDIHIPVTQKRAFFIDGKFEQFQRNVPYLAWSQAFNKFIDLLLTEGEEVIEGWKINLINELGEMAGIITAVLPSLEKIIGKQPILPEMQVNEAQNRFNYAFRIFIKTISTKEHPLVIFIDDFQWADAASLNLLRIILTEPGLGYLFVIGAYRDNEVNDSHPFVVCVDELEKEWQKMNKTDISEAYAKDSILIKKRLLQNLSVNNIADMITEALAMEKEKIIPLAELIYMKTQGNAFFVHRFLESLYDEGCISLKMENGYMQWRYDYEGVLKLNITDNVIDLLSRKVEKLNHRTRDLLYKASCIGFQFDLHTLSVIDRTSMEEIREVLNEAIEEGFIIPVFPDFRLIRNHTDSSLPSRHKFRFSHDRVKQAVYSFLQPEEKQRIHKEAGLLLLHSLDDKSLDEKIFEVANHINEANEYLKDPKLKASINFKAGVKAKASTAYGPAYSFLIKAIEALQFDAWVSDYAFTLSAYNHTSEAAYLSGNYTEMERLLDVILHNATTTLDKARAMEIRTNALFVMLKFKESIASGLEALRLLDYKLPEKPGRFTILFELVRAKVFLFNKSPEQFVNLPEMTDQRQIAIIKILSNLAPPVFFSEPNLYPIIILRMVEISVKYGIASSSPYSFAAYGILLCGVTNEVKRGIQYGRLCQDLLNKFDFTEFRARAMFSIYFFIDHWDKHSFKTLQPLKESYQRSLESGEADFTAFLGNAYSQVAILNAVDLEEVSKELQKQYLYATQTKQLPSATFNRIYDQYILCLQGKTMEPHLLKGESYSAEAMQEELVRTNNKSTLFNQNYYQAQLSLFFGEYEMGIRSAEIANEHIKTVVSVPVFKHFPFIDLLLRYHIVCGDKKLWKRHWAKIKKDLKSLKRFSRYCPEEFEVKLKIANACIARLNNNNAGALALFIEALSQMQHRAHNYDQGIVLLEFYRFSKEAGYEEMAALYKNKAMNWFNNWGGSAVTAYLKNQDNYHLFPTRGVDDASTMDDKPNDTNSYNNSNSEIDFYSILKGSQIISRELDSHILNARMLEIMVENAGAEKGVLILVKDEKCFVETEYRKDGSIHQLSSVPLAQFEGVALSVLNYVFHSKQDVVLDNAVEEGRFKNDSYIRDKKVQSLLCFNIRFMERITGIVYLENNLVPGAFTTNRTEILKILGSQAAISIENAKFYNDIQELNKSYERFVPKSFLAQLEKQSILDIKLGNQVVKDMSVLFSDIRNFTTISEKVSASEIFALLNEIWNVLTPVIDEHNGIIDKYIGDAIMALFPVNPADAVYAGIGLQKKLKEFNKEREVKGLFPINIGVGINSGVLILGTVGSETRLNTTVIGNTVNVTARLESLTKELKTGLILTEEMVEKLPDRSVFNLRNIGLYDLKGKTAAIRIFEEFSNDTEQHRAAKVKYSGMFTNAIKLFEEGHYGESVIAWDEYAALVPDDGIVNYYRHKIDAKKIMARS